MSTVDLIMSGLEPPSSCPCGDLSAIAPSKLSHSAFRPATNKWRAGGWEAGIGV